MIKRETYMSRIRPFMNNDLIKVLTGIRRSGKSVMLELIKEELIDFYKQNCFSSSFNKIEEKINSYINEFKYESSYIDGCINIHYNQEKIKMMGYLYKTTPSFINFKYYFTGTTNSIPEATSIKVETLTVSDQI